MATPPAAGGRYDQPSLVTSVTVASATPWFRGSGCSATDRLQMVPVTLVTFGASRSLYHPLEGINGII
jgi:hypothetical protein